MTQHWYAPIAFAASVWLSATCADAGDWPRWRGTNGLGVAEGAALPAEWSTDGNVAWSLAIPEWGTSSPVIIGNRIYLTTQTADNALHVLAVDRTKGTHEWQRQVGKGRLKTHNLHNMATPTPVADQDHVWALFGTGDLACLDRTGRELWRKDMQKEHGAYKVKWGMGTSPVLHSGALFITCVQAGPSYVLALDAQTGRTLWKQSRDLPANGEGNDAYSTPIMVGEGAAARLVVAGAEHLTAYSPADGTELWRCRELGVDHQNGRTIASPTLVGDLIAVVASGFRSRGRTVALRTGGTGDITATHQAWTHAPNSPDCPTPICYQGLLYMIDDKGQATCMNAADGSVQWQKRLLPPDVKASPVAGDGKVYFLNTKGRCAVVKSGPEGTVLSENALGPGTVATPAICDGTIYIRTRKALYAIRQK